MAEFADVFRKNIETMNRLEGFDIVIVCCSGVKQAECWQTRLNLGKGVVVPLNSIVITVDEDWPGGAGNALGTLYAFEKAAIVAKKEYGRDILQELSEGRHSVGLYHTAGKGTRLAPLPGSESNNKPGVKLPMTITLQDGSKSPITIIEGAIKQTGCYAKCRLGRLSVFWGDQVFVPSVPVLYEATHHVDILCTLGPMLISEAAWIESGMDKNGIIVVYDTDRKAAQIEKVDYNTAQEMLGRLSQGNLDSIQGCGRSLGSFSLSAAMLSELLDEFQPELAAKQGKLDSDPHLWMPMTLDLTSYLHLMAVKGMSSAQATAHYERIQRLVLRFKTRLAIPPTIGLFGAVNAGQEVLIWDYGQLKLYQRNNLVLCQPVGGEGYSCLEADMLRLFLGSAAALDDTGCYLSPDSQLAASATALEISGQSSISNSIILGSSSSTIAATGEAQVAHPAPAVSSSSTTSSPSFVRASVLSNVRCETIAADHCILINVTAKHIVARPGSILYNLVCDGTIAAEDDQTICGVMDEQGEQTLIHSRLDIDGGKAWESRVAGNLRSFEEVHRDNQTVSPAVIEEVSNRMHNSTWQKIVNEH